MYYTLFVFTALYASILTLDFYIEQQNLKYKKSFWKDKTYFGKIVYKEVLPEKIFYILKSDKKNVLLIDNTYYDNFKELNLGDLVETTTFSRALVLQNDYDKYLYNAYNIDDIAYIKEIINSSQTNNFVLKLFNSIIKKTFVIRNYLIAQTNNKIEYPYNSIILRLSLGYKNIQMNEILEYFQDAGVIHLLVVSGLHVGFIYLMFYFLLKFIPLIPRKIKIIISMFGIIFYMFLTGNSPPVVRSTIIFLCLSITLLVNREYSQYHVLTFAGLILLLINNRNLFNPSFQLSFMACFGIIYFYPILYNLIKEFVCSWKKVYVYFLKLFIVTLSAQLFILPIIILYFNKFSIISFVSNIILIPISSILLWLSMIYYIITPIYELSFYLSTFVQQLTFVYLTIVKFFANIPFSSIRFLSLTTFDVITYYITIILITTYLKKKNYINTIKIFVLVLIYIFVTKIFSENKFKITFFDIGLGNATLVQTQDKKYFLIDAGGNYNYDTGRYKIFPYLLKNKIKKIDYVILTHAHFPHYEGMKFLIKNVKIDNLIINNYPTNDIEYKNLIYNINPKSTNVIILNNPKNIKYQNGEICLYPSIKKTSYDEILLCDQNSILISVKYKDFYCLLTNDLPNNEIEFLLKENDIPKEITALSITKKQHLKLNIKSKVLLVANSIRIKPNQYKTKELVLFLDDGDVQVVYYKGKNFKKIEKVNNLYKMIY